MPQTTEVAIATTPTRSDRQTIPPKTEPLTDSDRAIIASVLTWDTQRQVNPEEIETIAITHDIAWIKLTNNRAIPIHVETFRSIRRQQLEQQEPDQEPEIEIDSDESSDPTYRVWKSWHFLGSFHQSPVDGRWLTYPTFGRDYDRHGTSDEAIAAIVNAWNDAIEVRYEQGLEAA